MNKAELMRKVNNEEGLTVEEIIQYRKLIPPKKEVYGKYGNLALQYLEQHNVGKFWALAGDLPEYLHGIDQQAEVMYDTIRDRLVGLEQNKKNGDYLHDLRIETEIAHIIDEQILNELVYVQ
jgi:hypothetical protein